MLSLLQDVAYGLKDSLSGWWVAIQCWRQDAKKISHKPPPPKGFSQISRKRHENTKEKKESDGTMTGIIWDTIMTAGVALLITFLIETICVYLGSLFGNRFNLGWNMSSFILHFLWWVPSMIVIKLTSIINNNEVADKVFEYKYGQPKFTPLELTISEFVFSSVYQTIFIIQASVVYMVVPWPIAAMLLEWLHYSLFYAVYAFEYKWALLGIASHKRVAQLENNWPYYFAFGLPVHLATAFWQSLYTRTMAFALLFPFVILGATAAPSRQSEFKIPLRIMFPSVYVTDKAYMFLRSVLSTKKTTLQSHVR